MTASLDGLSGLNPLESGQSFELRPTLQVVEVPEDGLNPLESGQSFESETLRYIIVEEFGMSQSPRIGAVIRIIDKHGVIETLRYVSIPSNRGSHSNMH